MGGSLREFKGGKNTLGYYITGQRPWERRGHVLILLRYVKNEKPILTTTSVFKRN